MYIVKESPHLVNEDIQHFTYISLNMGHSVINWSHDTYIKSLDLIDCIAETLCPLPTSLKFR